MKIENLFEQVSTLDSFDEKSGVLANAVISNLDAPISNAALMCGLIYWFNEDVIKSFINDDSIAQEAINTILRLPFVEAKGNGFTFHESVRNGLRSSYEKEPDLIIKAYSTALPELLNNMDNDMAGITAAYGLIATNDSKANDTISSLLERFTNSHQLNKLKVFVHDMQEVLWLVTDNTLSDKQWLQIGSLQLSNAKLDDATSSCERALRVNPSNEDAFLLQATVNELRGDFDTALNNLNETIVKFPKSINPYIARANLYILREEYSHASSDYYKALEINPKSSFAYIGLARIFKEKGNKAKQLSLYKQAIDLDPDNIWIYIERGTVLSDYGRYQEALSDFNKALEINSYIDIVLLGRATIYEEEEKYDLALADLQSALTINPNNVIAIHKIANIYYSLGKYYDAFKSLQEVISINPEYALAYGSLWETCVKIGDIEQARNYFLKALDLRPQNSSVYYNELILTARKLKEFELGILAAQKGLQFNSDESFFYVALGYFYIQLGELDLAESNLNRALISKNNKTYEEEAYVDLGVTRWLKGDKPTSQQMFQRAMKLLIEKERQSVSFDENKKAKSQKQALHGVAKQKSYILGWVNIMMGRTETGISQIEKYIKDNPDKTGAFFDLRDWANAISKSTDVPIGIDELLILINHELSE